MGALRHRLIPEAGARGMRLALLANARPGGLRLRNDERDAVFARVELNPAETQRYQISVTVQQQVAPTAIALLGAARVQALCGERPIIAMFIARELERRAQENTLDESSLVGLRGGDLSGWLRRRLAEDRLLAPDSGTFLPSCPEPSVVAAAAALVVAPLPLNEMTAGVALTLEAAECSGRVQVDSVIRMLLALGWLEQRGQYLAAAHDVVADEVLEQTFWEQPGDAVRTLMLDQVLSAALKSPRCLGRLAVALSRLLGPTPASQAFKGALQVAAVSWLAAHADVLGLALADGDPDEVSFALGAALGGPPWSDACVEQWDRLVAPWLTRHGGLWEARHVFYRGLKFLPGNSAGELIGVALCWLGIHIQQPDADFVLGPLLAREDLGDHAPTAIAHAMAWLEPHASALEAGFVLPPLLAREDLGAHVPTAIARAMAWLEPHSKALEARFVLPPLLARKDLGEGHTPTAIARAMAWLEPHASALEAGFVLPPLLAREDLGAHASTAIARAMAWIEPHGKALEAGFVFAPLLDREDLGAHAPTAIARAMAWLEPHGKALGAGFVLPPLLAREDLREQQPGAIERAVTWLEAYPDIQDTEFVLKRLLGSSDVPSALRLRCANVAVDRLEKVSSTPDATFLLRWCLQERKLPIELEQRIVGLAFAWMDAHPSHRDIDYVFNRLLRRRHIPDTDWQRAARFALEWLKRTPPQRDRDRALNSLLTRPGLLDASDWDYVLNDALRWLEGHCSSSNAAGMLRYNLMRCVTGTAAEPMVTVTISSIMASKRA